MAAGRLPAPGTGHGPCVEPPGCQHTDCACTRRMAEALCRICGQPIGYETRFYDDRERGSAHADCAEREVEAQHAG